MDQLRPSDTTFINPPMENMVSVAMDQPVINSTTKEFNIENIKPENKSFTVDLMGDEADVSFAKVKTPDARPDVSNSTTSYINPPPGLNNGSGISPSGAPLIKSRDELRSGVKAAIMVIDYVVSLIAMKIAGDTRQQAHTADAGQKKLLEDVIVEYLFGKQQAMPLWMTMAFAVIGSYGIIIFAAIKQRNTINKNKKLNAAASGNNPSYKEPVSLRGESHVKSEDVRKYEAVRPPVSTPREPLTLNKVYADKNKDGVMEPVSTTSFTDTINPPKKSSPEYPDETLVAANAMQARAYAAKGQYPMYRKSLTGKLVKMKYNENGTPIMAGKSSKLVKRK